MIAEAQVRVDASVEEVFDAMADLRNEPVWNPQVSSCELVTQGEVGEGSHFRTIDGGRPYDAVITEHDRPTKLVVTARSEPLVVVRTLRFDSMGESTVLSAHVDLRPTGFGRLVLPLHALRERRELAAQLDSFSRFCAARA